jgi:hypothetical protein
MAVAPPQKAEPISAPKVLPFRLSDGTAHENLTIFFLFGEDQIKGKKILTLNDALKDKKVIVHETKNVNELAIENVSTDDVFVQAGDIVKGGQQDRIIALDAIIQAKSGRLPINSFCVEQGRWSKRGGEKVDEFSSNTYTVTGNSTKIAARGDKSQGSVWKEVGQQQEKLAKALKSEVKDSRSQTSLQLTLEHKKVQEAIEAYIKKLEPTIPADNAGNVIGYAVAINGKVMSADVYANSDLFRRLWPKLLRSTVIEAVGEKQEKIKIATCRPEAVTIFLADAASGKRTERSVGRGREVMCETSKNVLFETKLDGEKGKPSPVIRQSYISK